MSTFVEQLSHALASPGLPPAPNQWVVAFSGGLDSTALLHGLVQLQGAARVRAIHVNHGLAAAATTWADACGRVADKLQVNLRVVSVQVNLSGAASVEAAARRARYAALAAHLEPAEVLLTAHHADDQLETMLLAMLRGAGLRGLRGALPLIRFGSGFLLRPLLALSREAIHGWAREQGLSWLEDPSNQELRFDRNYLRHEVMPALLARWPGAGAAANRAAGHVNAAVHLTEQLACRDQAQLDDPRRPLAVQIRRLDPHRQRNLLRYLIKNQDLPPPSAAQLEALRASVAEATATSRRVIQWPAAVARWYRGRLYLGAPLVGAESDRLGRVSVAQPYHGPSGPVSLTRCAAGLPAAWSQAGFTVRYRSGGERFHAAGAARARSLKRLLAEARVVPWMRPHVPLLYFENELVAVADLWVSQRALDTGQGGPIRYQVQWRCPQPVF